MDQGNRICVVSGSRVSIRRMFLFTCLALAAWTLCGCDSEYRVMFENHTDQAILVEMLGTESEVGPCSAVYGGWRIAAGSFDTEGPSYTVRNLEKQIVAEGRARAITTSRAESWRHHWLEVRFPANGSSGCPDPIRDAYRIVIVNRTGEPLHIVLGDIDLGLVGPEEVITVGPFRGLYMDPVSPRVPSAQQGNRIGDDLVSSFSMPNTALGDLPIVRYEIEHAKSWGWVKR